MSNVIIIGNGPAGISAALYTKRAGIDTTIIGRDDGALQKAAEIENYYGFSDPITGAELISNGKEGAKRLGVRFVSDEVVGLSYTEKLTVITKTNVYMADSVIIATGTARTTPQISGIKDLEGRGVSYCAVCDAFFYRNLDVAVLGNGSYALHEAKELLATSRSVTILTNGKEPEVEFPDSVTINTSPISAILGNDSLSSVQFIDGSNIKIAGLFVAIGIAGSADLARKIGAQTNGNIIEVDQNMATTIPGLYAAGDCTGGLLQISKAVYEGAKAGTEVIKYIRKQVKKISA